MAEEGSLKIDNLELLRKEDKVTIRLNEVDKVEILTLQDNYVDIASMDNTDIVHRGMPIKDMEIKSSILAEHGFSLLEYDGSTILFFPILSSMALPII